MNMNLPENFVRDLIDKPKKIAFLLIWVLSIIIIFSFLALLPLWIAKKMEILPLQSPTIRLQEKVIQNGSNYIVEHAPLSILDIEIKIDVITLDDLVFSDNEKSTLNYYANQFPKRKRDIEILSNGFNIERSWNLQSYPITSDSFKRFQVAMSNLLIRESFFSEERKRIFLSQKYWEIADQGVRIMIFPPEIQHAVSVFVITGASSSATLYLSGLGDKLSQAIRIASGQQTKHIECSESTITACTYIGETLRFKSNHYLWSIKTKSIVNPGYWRGSEDFVIIDWKAVDLSKN